MRSADLQPQDKLARDDQKNYKLVPKGCLWHNIKIISNPQNDQTII